MAGGFGSRRGRKERRQLPGPGKQAPGKKGTGAGAGGADGKQARKKRMPDSEVRWILTRERREFAPDTSGLPERTAEALRRGIEASRALGRSFAEYQDEVRAEYEAKGYVEVDDGFFDRREQQLQVARRMIDSALDGIDFSNVPLSDHYYADLYDDEQQDEDEEQGEEVRERRRASRG